MGLLIKKELPTGEVVEYHKITVTNIDWHRKNAVISVASFIDKEIRDAGKSSVITKLFEFRERKPLIKFPFDLERNVVEDAYKEIKRLPEWKDAVDV